MKFPQSFALVQGETFVSVRPVEMYMKLNQCAVSKDAELH